MAFSTVSGMWTQPLDGQFNGSHSGSRNKGLTDLKVCRHVITIMFRGSHRGSRSKGIADLKVCRHLTKNLEYSAQVQLLLSLFV